MKKYLIKGALALFAGGLLFSCAEKEAEYVPLAQQKVKAFEDVESAKKVIAASIERYLEAHPEVKMTKGAKQLASDAKDAISQTVDKVKKVVKEI